MEKVKKFLQKFWQVLTVIPALFLIISGFIFCNSERIGIGKFDIAIGIVTLIVAFFIALNIHRTQK